MRVYTVTFGEYSDAYVAMVCSTKEKAEQYAKSQRRKDYSIEEFIVDLHETGQVREIWATRIILRTGEIRFTRMFGRQLVENEHWSECVYHPDGGPGKHLEVYSAHSREMVLKLATEARQKWLRERELRRAER
jgi:hypothetical protein